MQGLELKIHHIAAILGGIGGFLFGKWDLPLQILLTAIVLDYISGMLKAFYLGEVSSRKGYKGLIKKVGILFTIVVANLTDLILNLTRLLFQALSLYFTSIKGTQIWSSYFTSFTFKVKSRSA